MSSGSAGLAALSAFASLFSVTFLGVEAVGTAVTFCVVCTCDLGVTRLAGLSFFAVFFFLAVLGWLTSSVMPQRSSNVSCTPAEYFGRGSISGFSSADCGFSVGVSTACAGGAVSNFMAGRSISFCTATLSSVPTCRIVPEYRRMASCNGNPRQAYGASPRLCLRSCPRADRP